MGKMYYKQQQREKYTGMKRTAATKDTGHIISNVGRRQKRI